MLVALGVVLVVVAAEQSGMDSEGVSRVIQGVFAGIGFLGRGHHHQAYGRGRGTWADDRGEHLGNRRDRDCGGARSAGNRDHRHAIRPVDTRGAAEGRAPLQPIARSRRGEQEAADGLTNGAATRHDESRTLRVVRMTQQNAVAHHHRENDAP
jgi:hypothetical protein